MNLSDIVTNPPLFLSLELEGQLAALEAAEISPPDYMLTRACSVKNLGLWGELGDVYRQQNVTSMGATVGVPTTISGTGTATISSNTYHTSNLTPTPASWTSTATVGNVQLSYISYTYAPMYRTAIMKFFKYVYYDKDGKELFRA